MPKKSQLIRKLPSHEGSVSAGKSCIFYLCSKNRNNCFTQSGLGLGWTRLGNIQKARIIFPEILREVSLVISEQGPALSER